MKKAELVKAAKEFNKVVELADDNGKLIKFNLKSKTLEKDVFDELHHIEPGDEFTDTTDKVFNELKIKFTPKPKPESKSKVKKEKAVEVGTTVELDIDTDKIKNKGKMKKKNDVGNPQMEAARILLSKTAKKADLMELLENAELYPKKVKKAMLKVTNFLSLKKQMQEVIDPDILAEVKKEIAAAKPKATSKPKVKKDSPIVAEIKAAIKVKQLKKIAKENDQFNWKKLKKMEFDEMQKAMLKTKPVVKIKMIPNPVIAEIEGFKKAKKLVKWVKAHEIIEYVKAMKKMDLADLQGKLISSIDAEIEAGSGGKRGAVVNHIDQEARKARIIELISGGDYTQKELKAILIEEFPEEGKSHTNANILSECKSTREYKDGILRWERFGIGRLVVADENGHYRFADELKKSKKSGKKDKKNKKNKKGNK